jgi:hypothetical protein
MKVDEEIDALLTLGRKRSIGLPVPKNLAPILKRMSERAQKGDIVGIRVLQDYVEKVTGTRRGVIVLARWVKESGGRPWFRA